MPGDKSIVFWSEGKIKKINIESLEVTNIPFQVETKIKIAEAQRAETPVYKKNLLPKQFEMLPLPQTEKL